jgi:hypothetical protein
MHRELRDVNSRFKLINSLAGFTGQIPNQQPLEVSDVQGIRMFCPLVRTAAHTCGTVNPYPTEETHLG